MARFGSYWNKEQGARTIDLFVSSLTMEQGTRSKEQGAKTKMCSTDMADEHKMFFKHYLLGMVSLDNRYRVSCSDSRLRI